jgi:hypothetical protein
MISRRDVFKGLGAIVALAGAGIPALKGATAGLIEDAEGKCTYILFKDLPLINYGNQIPVITQMVYKQDPRPETVIWATEGRGLFPYAYVAEPVEHDDLIAVLDDHGRVFRGYQYTATFAFVMKGETQVSQIWLGGREIPMERCQVIHSRGITPAKFWAWVEAGLVPS